MKWTFQQIFALHFKNKLRFFKKLHVTFTKGFLIDLLWNCLNATAFVIKKRTNCFTYYDRAGSREMCGPKKSRSSKALRFLKIY